MEEEKIVESLSEKSKSLRKTSLRKRVHVEIKKIIPKVKEKCTKKRKLSKYRRKTANAKERERMKKMNDVFATLKSVIPADNKDDHEEEKETKVTTLRSAIQYINYLKQLIDDCDAGLVDEKEMNEKVMIERNKTTAKSKTQKEKPKQPKSVKSSKPIILDTKWTNYSPELLGKKFVIPKDQNIIEKEEVHQMDASYQDIVLHPLPHITTFY